MHSKNIIIGSLLAIAVLGVAVYALFFSKGEVYEDMAEETRPVQAVPLSAEPVDIDALISEKNLDTIYLAGGCFWGVEEYMSRIAGVYDATSGYANGNTENPKYEEVIYDNTGHAETVRVVYDPEQVTLDELLERFFRVVDPTSLNKQGNDVGTQYRSGVYYTSETDKAVVDKALETLQLSYDKPIVVESLMLENFYDAEEYHQDYLRKNVNGYCHIDLSKATEEVVIDGSDYIAPSKDELEDTLSKLEFNVTQNSSTETAFSSELNDNYDVGIYVDIVTGEPLFLSKDKFDSGTGWPSFTKPIVSDVIVEDTKNASVFFGTEVKSRSGLSHLGHVFNDGPENAGGLRYCINGAALKFVAYNDMVSEGYGYLQHLL